MSETMMGGRRDGGLFTPQQNLGCLPNSVRPVQGADIPFLARPPWLTCRIHLEEIKDADPTRQSAAVSTPAGDSHSGRFAPRTPIALGHGPQRADRPQ